MVSYEIDQATSYAPGLNSLDCQIVASQHVHSNVIFKYTYKQWLQGSFFPLLKMYDTEATKATRSSLIQRPLPAFQHLMRKAGMPNVWVDEWSEQDTNPISLSKFVNVSDVIKSRCIIND